MPPHLAPGQPQTPHAAGPVAAAEPAPGGWRAWVQRLGLGLWRLAGGRPEPSASGMPPLRLAALQRSEEQLRLAEHVAQVGSFEWYPGSGALHWSDQHFTLWGLLPGAVMPDYAVFRAGIHPDDVLALEALLQQALAGGRLYDCAHRVVWPDGTVRQIQGRGEVLFDAQGTAVRMIGTVRDTTAEHAVRAALAASVGNLTLTLNATGDGIFASDARSPDQPLLFVNERLLQIWNIPQQDAPHLTPADIITAARRYFVEPEREVARILELIAANQPAEDRLLLNDGRVLIRRCVTTMADGRHVRVWGFRDVTAQAQAQADLRLAEAQQRALLDAFPGYIACVDEGLRFTYVNDRLAQVIGMPADVVVGLPAWQRPGKPDVHSQFADDVQRALAGETVVCERAQPRADGQPAIQLLVTLAPGTRSSDGRRLVYAFGTDITTLKAAEAALVHARDEAEAANRAKSAFLSSMSHELRTPMNAVLGFAQLMQAQGGLSPRHERYLSEIQRGGQHLLALINDLLDMARIEAGKLALDPQPLAMHEVAAECVALVQPAAMRRNVRVTLADDAGQAQVMADRTRLKQVLVNLLDNAIKYNHEAGWVRLELGLAPGRVSVAVRDGGPGLTAAQVQRLFQPFERLDASRSAVEGTGIGLALSRRLMVLMGGDIGVDSTSGAGCRFYFDLPLAQVPVALPAATRALPAAAPAPSPMPTKTPIMAPTTAPTTAPTLPAADEATPSPSRTVLYIEDNPVNAMLMSGLLEALPSVRLLHAATPAAGLMMAERAQPDLVLLDITMPDMDGFEVLARLREQPSTAHLTVVAVSANTQPQDLARAHAAGFAGYLTKPLEVALLLRTVAQHLRLDEPPGTA